MFAKYVTVGVLGCLFSAQVFFAQCSMCRTAAAQGDQAAAINSGILVLFLPAVTLFSTIVFLAFRFQRDGASSSELPPDH